MSKPNEKQRTFCELVSRGVAPYKACIQAGYSEKYAKTDSHKLREKYEKEIAKLEEIAKEIIEENFEYSINESFKKLCEIQEMALNSLDKNGNPNLNALIKAEELKGKMFGLYKMDNEQKYASYQVSINRVPVEAVNPYKND